MEQSVSASVQPVRKLQIAMSSPAVCLQVDMPSGVDGNAYFTFLAARIANDFETFTANTATLSGATVTVSRDLAESLGVEMSERIAKIETSLQHLIETVGKIDAKLDAIAKDVSNEKAVNVVIDNSLITINEKLDKKASKDEVAKLISAATLKQVLWTAALLVALGGTLYRILT